MVRASSLYLVIIISLVVALMCSSLIVAAYYYKLSYQQKIRTDRLRLNVQSGVNILLADDSEEDRLLDLFGDNVDSVRLKKISWGVYDIGVSMAFIQNDTLSKVFSIANTIDSTKWSSIYLVDEDRPLSVSGHTEIVGNVYLPKAGIKAAYVDNKAYEGNPAFVKGHIYNSTRNLPALEGGRLAELFKMLKNNNSEFLNTTLPDSLNRSFIDPVCRFVFNKPFTVENCDLRNHIVLLSDTSLVIDSTARLDNVLIFAKSVTFKSGFSGKCQVFATDSISVGPRCKFDYPSCLGLYREISPQENTFKKISIGQDVKFSGVILAADNLINEPLPVYVELGKDCRIFGQVYCQGVVSLKDNITIAGSVYAKKFLYRSKYSAYENYLINIKIDARSLRPYYLTPLSLPVSGKKKKILEWIE